MDAIANTHATVHPLLPGEVAREAPRPEVRQDHPLRPGHGGRAPKPRDRAWIRRGIKISAAAGLMAAAIGAALSERGYVASEAAVVSAFTVPVRSPIEGYASGPVLQLGEPVAAGQLLARVENPRVDDQRLVDLRQAVARHQAELTAVEAEREALRALQAVLKQRSDEHRAAVLAQLQAQVQAADRVAAARQARRDLTAREWQRRSALGREGVVSGVELDRLRSESEVADREAAAAEAQLMALRAQLAAAERGIFVDGGSNDVAYSSQRADEVTLRLAAAERAIATLAAAEAEASARLVEEERRIRNLRTAELTSPVNGTVWHLGASAGERIGSGEFAAQIVDCSAAFLIVAVPQDRVPDLQVGAMARFRLAGEKVDREGRVAAVTGDAGLAPGRNLAAMPQIQSRTPMAAVRVEMDAQPAEGCLVGRTARALLPSNRAFNPPALLRAIL